MATIQERIQIIVEWMTKGMKPLQNQMNAIDKGVKTQTAGFQRLNVGLKRAGLEINKFGGAYGKLGEQYPKLKGGLNALNTGIKKNATRIQATMAPYKRFSDASINLGGNVANVGMNLRANTSLLNGWSVGMQKSLGVDVAGGLEKQSTRYQRLRTDMRNAVGVMRMTMQESRGLYNETGKMDKSNQKLSGTLSRSAFRFRNLTRGLRGFKMEMLSVMFFGMGMQRFFMGLLKPAFELTGLFEIWSSVLTILFLPVALALIPFMLKLLEIVIAMPDEQKKMIGYFVIAGAVLGTMIMVLGMVVLGLGGIGAALGPVGLALTAVFGIGGAAIVGLPLLGGLFKILGINIGGLGNPIDSITGSLNQFKEDGTLTAEEVKTAFMVAGVDIGDSAEKIASDLNAIPGKIKTEDIETIKDKYGLVIEEVKAGFDTLVDKMVEVIDKILRKITESLPEFTAKAVKIVVAIAKVLGERLPDLIVSFLQGIWTGISEAFYKPRPEGMEWWKESPFFPGRVSRGYQHGGIVSGRFGSPVPIIAHAGERVIPANRSGGGDTYISITIDAEISSEIDLDRVASEVSTRIATEMGGMAR